MIKVKEFWRDAKHGVDYFINDFIEDNNDRIEIVDVKYQSYHDTINDVLESTALLIYRKTSDKEIIDNYFLKR